MALVHVCHVLWAPSDCSFSDIFYLSQAGNTWLEPPHFLLQFSQNRTLWVPLLDLRQFLFSLLYQIPLLFSSPPKFRCPLSVLPVDILSSLNRSHNSDRVNFDLCLFNDLNWLWLFSLGNCCAIYHRVFPQENLLSLHIQYVPELLIILHQGFHSVRSSTIFSILPNSKLWSLPVCLTFLILSLTNISYFLVQKNSQVWSHLFIFLFIIPVSSFSETQ